MTERNLDDLTNEEVLALSRAAEAKANVFRGLAARDDKYRTRLADVTAEAQEYADHIRDQGLDPASTDPTSTVPDKEGTAPSLADGEGNFADHAEIANLGGIGINDSNTNPEAVRAELAARADPDAVSERTANVEKAQRIIDAGGDLKRAGASISDKKNRGAAKRERVRT
jgi:hypothetical protein